LVAASFSEWNEIHTIHTTGRTNSRPMIQARTPSRAPDLFFGFGVYADPEDFGVAAGAAAAEEGVLISSPP